VTASPPSERLPGRSDLALAAAGKLPAEVSTRASALDSKLDPFLATEAAGTPERRRAYFRQASLTA